MNRPSVPVSSCEVGWGPKEGAVALLEGPASGTTFIPVRPFAGRRYRVAGSASRARRVRFQRYAPAEHPLPVAVDAEISLAEISGATDRESAGPVRAVAHDLTSEAAAHDAAVRETIVHETVDTEIADPEPPSDAASAPPKEKGLLHYLGTAISAALLILVLGIAALVIAAPAVVGGQALTVLTQSMEPGLPPGTLIVIRPTPAADIRIGDVITYQIASDQPAVVSHRVVTKSIGTDGQTTFTTKGDNNDLVDQNPVMEVQVRGTLWYSIPYLGWVNNAVNGDARTFIVPIAAGGLFLYALYMFGGSVRERIRKRRALAAA